MADKEAQPSMSTTRRRMHGPRWATYLLKEKVVHAVRYQMERSLLLEEEIRMANALSEWI